MFSLNKLTLKLFIPLFLSVIQLCGQDCGNLGFEQGNFSGWQAHVGTVNEEGEAIYNNSGSPESFGSRFKLSKDLPEIDGVANSTNCFDLNIKTRNEHSSHSVRLGNSSSGAQCEKLTRIVTITEESSLLLYRYAVIFQDPGHADHEQPKFQLTIKDTNDNVLPCGEVSYSAGAGLDGFVSCNGGQVLARDWNTAALDLRPYIGQEIVLEFETRDCAQGGHFGYAYFDLECGSFEFPPYDYCNIVKNSDSLVLYAPEGYQSYKWDDKSTLPYKVIYDPDTTTIHTVSMKGDNDCEVVLDKKLELPYITQPIVSDYQTEICIQDSAEINLNGQDVFFYLNEDLTDTLYPNNPHAIYYDEEDSLKYYAVGHGYCLVDSFNVIPLKLGKDSAFVIPDSVAVCPNISVIDVNLNSSSDNLFITWNNGEEGYEAQYNLDSYNLSYGIATVKTHENCEYAVSDTFIIAPVPPPIINTEFGLQDSCPPLKTEIRDYTINSVQTNYYLNGEEISLIERDTFFSKSFTLVKSGIYNLVIDAISEDGCFEQKTIDSAYIVYPHSKVKLAAEPFELGDTLDVWEVTDITNDYFGIFREWSSEDNFWEVTEDKIQLELSNTDLNHTYVYLVRINEFGCTDSAEIDFSTFSKSIYIPNTFSPDLTGIDKTNNTFIPICHNCIPEESTYQIANRWGEIIFKSNFTQEWNGVTKDNRIADKGQYTVLSKIKYINLEAEEIVTPLFLLK